MNSRVIAYGSMAMVLVYFGLDHVNGKVDSLRAVHVSVPASHGVGLNVQQFYPVLAEGVASGASSGRADLNDAFYEPPPEINVTIVDAPPPTDEVGPSDKDLAPEPIAPINFLANQTQRFNLQATMPNQGAAIINGTAYLVGDQLPGRLGVFYQDEYGEERRTMLEVRVGQVSRGAVVLVGNVPEGWEQSLRLQMKSTT